MFSIMDFAMCDFALCENRPLLMQKMIVMGSFSGFFSHLGMLNYCGINN